MSRPLDDIQIRDLRKTLRQRLKMLYQDRLFDVILFGSYARGEAHEESDLDVLVVLCGSIDSEEERPYMVDLATDLLERYGVVVSPVLISEAEFRSARWPLLINVRDEGVPL